MKTISFLLNASNSTIIIKIELTPEKSPTTYPPERREISY